MPFEALGSDVFLVGVMGSGLTLLTQIGHQLRSNGSMSFEAPGRVGWEAWEAWETRWVVVALEGGVALGGHGLPGRFSGL